MHPDDRVLVAVMSRAKDFEIARDQGWYRVPEHKATRGVFFEYLAFYFTSAFANLAWGVHYYARCLGYELLTRRDLLPDEPDHPRADDPYYRIQIGPLLPRVPPILSRRWRRIAFIHTTWDRFEAAQEINDLFAEGDQFVDRLYHALCEQGFAPERCYPVREAGAEYLADLALPCRGGLLAVNVAETRAEMPGTLYFTPGRIASDPQGCLDAIRLEIERRDGILPLPSQVESVSSRGSAGYGARGGDE